MVRPSKTTLILTFRYKHNILRHIDLELAVTRASFPGKPHSGAHVQKFQFTWSSVNNKLVTETEVFKEISQPKSCLIDRAIARPIWQGRCVICCLVYCLSVFAAP